MDTINFKARFLNNATVSKLNPVTGKYEKQIVSLLKVNKNSYSDLSALFQTNKLWSDSLNYLGAIMLSFYSKDAGDRKVYILTEQNDNFRTLIPEKILGIEELRKDGNLYRLDYIQTNPNTKYKARNRKYKDIGKCLLNYVINKFGKNNEICLNAVSKSVKFYKKLGFKVVDKTLTDPLMIYLPAKTKKAVNK
jgi:hypothetical protein